MQHHRVVEVICSTPPLDHLGDLEQIAPDHLLNDLSSQDPTEQDLLLGAFEPTLGQLLMHSCEASSNTKYCGWPERDSAGKQQWSSESHLEGIVQPSKLVSIRATARKSCQVATHGKLAPVMACISVWSLSVTDGYRDHQRNQKL